MQLVLQGYITEVLKHYNPYMGLHYYEDPTILAFETGNELSGASTSALEPSLAAPAADSSSAQATSALRATLLQHGRPRSSATSAPSTRATSSSTARTGSGTVRPLSPSLPSRSS